MRGVHAIAVLVLAGCGGSARISDPIADMPAGHQRSVTRRDFQDDWPFVPGAGTLGCQDGAVAFRANGITYALNDRARARGYASIEALRVTQSVAPTNPLRRLRQEERVQIFVALASCRSAADAVRCRQRTAERHGLAPDEAQQIDVEGNERRWPPLAPEFRRIQKVLDEGLALCR